MRNKSVLFVIWVFFLAVVVALLFSGCSPAPSEVNGVYTSDGSSIITEQPPIRFESVKYNIGSSNVLFAVLDKNMNIMCYIVDGYETESMFCLQLEPFQGK